MIISFISFYGSQCYSTSSSTLKFHHLGVEDGLPRTIWAINQDEHGIMWFGSSRGLLSYDGYELKQFNNLTGNQTINANIVRAIYIDDNNEIIIGSYSGLARLNLESRALETINISLTEKSNLSDMAIFSITKTTSEQIWLGTNRGLIIVDPGFSKAIPLHKSLDSFLSGKRINTIIELTQDSILIGTNSGLIIWQASTKTISKIPIPHENISHLKVKTILQKRDGGLLIGTDKGLFLSSSDYNNIEQLYPELSNSYVFSIVEDNYNQLWIGTRDNGLFSIDNEGVLQNFSYDKTNPYALSDRDIYSLFVDHSGILWAGTFNSGLNSFDPTSQQFEFFNDSQSSLSCLKSPVIYSILENNIDSFWLGTQQGVAKIDLKNDQCELYTPFKKNQMASYGYEVSFTFSLPQTPELIYLATANGVDIFNKKSLEIEHSFNQFPSHKTTDILVLDNGGAYLSTIKGLYFREKYEHKFKLVTSGNPNLGQTNYTQILRDKKNQIFLASWNGLLTVNSDNKINRVGWENEHILNQPIRAMHIDKHDNIWIGIDNSGLFSFSTDGKLLAKYQDIGSLPAIGGFSSIVGTNKDELWISSTNGLSRLQPSTGLIQNYHSSDGLAGESFTNAAHFVSNNGYIYFGNRKGLTRFNPDSISINQIPPKVTLSNFLYFNDSLEFGTAREHFSLSKPISQLKTLDLSYKDYVFGFEFSALHFSDPERNQYAYKMENWDTDWHYTNAKYRRATYSNLPAGDYVFKVKASNLHGVWSDTPTELKIHVSPAPWASIWAYLGYLITIIFSIFMFIRYRTLNLEKRSIELESSIALRTKELALEKSKVEQLLSRKNEEFTNVSHEFRTPLTLILGPTEQLLKEKNGHSPKKLKVIQRNGYRLLRMVDQLLNMESFRVKAITRRGMQSSHQIISMIAEAFKDLANKKDINLKLVHFEPVDLLMVPDSLEKMVLNILSNAVKYTNTGGHISIASYRTNSEHLQIQVIDTGIGIAKNKQARIFDRFHRILDQQSEQITGAGIGLALVKELVNAHSGSIEIDSQLGEGTEVNIFIPIRAQVNIQENNKINQQSNQEIVELELQSLGNQNRPISSTDLDLDNEKMIQVLIVEDNLDMQNYIAESLNNKYAVKLASNGKQGVEQAIAHIPDIIISDIMMPEMDGYQLTKMIRENQATSHIPIIILTARNDHRSKLKGWQEKADEYLIKPFNTKELLIRINNLLEIRNLIRKQFSQQVVSNTKIKTVKSNDQPDIQHKQQVFLDKLNNALESLYKDSDLKMSEVANKIAMSERQLLRKLKAIVGMSSNEYLRNFRLRKACYLLAEGETSSYVALDVGFSSHSYFGQCFKTQFNCLPSEYKKTAHTEHQ